MAVEKVTKRPDRPRWFERKIPSPALADKGDTVKRLDAFIKYELGQADEALRKLPADPSASIPTVSAAYEYWDLARKAEELKTAFEHGAKKATPATEG